MVRQSLSQNPFNLKVIYVADIDFCTQVLLAIPAHQHQLGTMLGVTNVPASTPSVHHPPKSALLKVHAR